MAGAERAGGVAPITERVIDENVSGFREWKATHLKTHQQYIAGQTGQYSDFDFMEQAPTDHANPTKMNYSEAFANLQRELDGNPDIVPEGWFTSHQWASHAQMSVANVQRWIKKGLDSGKMECQKFRIRSAGRNQVTPHYRISG